VQIKLRKKKPKQLVAVAFAASEAEPLSLLWLLALECGTPPPPESGHTLELLLREDSV